MAPLRLTRGQQEILIDQPRQQAAAAILGDLEASFGPQYACVGRDAMRAFVELGMRRGQRYGLRTERELGIYVEIMILLGSHFDEDPLVPWAVERLTRADGDAFERLQGLRSHAGAWLDRLNGPGEAAIRSALARAATLPYERIEHFEGSALRAALVQRFAAVYPEKAEAVGVIAVTRFVDELWRKHHARPGITAKGLAVLTTLATFIGIGVHADPRFAWIAHVLAEAESVPRCPAGELEGAAHRELPRWLAVRPPEPADSSSRRVHG